MKNKTYFELDKVIRINLQYEQERSDKIYYPEKSILSRSYTWYGWPKRVMIFIPERWAHREDTEYYDTMYEIENSNDLRLDKSTKKVYSLPNISINLSDKSSVYCRFNTNSELDDYVKDLVNRSNRTFAIIIG